MNSPLAIAIKKTLPDGSNVYNVRIYDDTSTAFLEIHGVTEDSARKIASAVNVALALIVKEGTK
jgi:hypothetical protein